MRCRAVAVDLRGHGDSRTGDDGDLSSDTLADDVCRVAEKVAPSSSGSPHVMLVGHSMGGALAVHAALKERIAGLVGICVIDVVEGAKTTNVL